MSITPKRVDIINRVLPKHTILTKSKIEVETQFIEDKGGSTITIRLLKATDDFELASYSYVVSGISPDLMRLGIMEGLVVARFATEAGVNIGHTSSMPTPLGYDELLTEYGMAVVVFDGEKFRGTILDTDNDKNTLLLSGGADSTHLLFKRLKGNANAATIYHGQGTYSTGLWPEDSASSEIVSLANYVFNTQIDHRKMSARWNCKIERQWAKAYRNFMLVTQAATVFPSTNIWVGTSIDDRLHDSFPDFIEGFSRTTGIQIVVPNIDTGRRTIMGDLIDLSLNVEPYIYASTTSCQLPRYLGKKYFYCGSCHSCILRLPAVEFRGDPRFSNFNTSIQLIPHALRYTFSHEDYFKRKPSSNALKTFFEDLGDTKAFDEFIPTLHYIDSEWTDYKLNKILSPSQIARTLADKISW